MTERKKIHIDKNDFFTVPNILTYIRIFLVPCFVIFYLRGFFKEPNKNIFLMWLGVCCIILASITDLIDGKIARAFNQVTELGKFLDPLADKMMQFAITVVVGIIFQIMTNEPYIWWLIGIFVFKEFSQFFLIYLLYRHGQYMDGAKWYGKVATFGFDVVMISLLTMPLFNYYNDTVYIILVVISGSLLIFAWIMYVIEVVHMWKSGINNIPESLYQDKDKKNNSKNKIG